MITDVTRRSLLVALVLATAVMSAGPLFAAEKAKQPNVILVMTDDQGYGDIRAHGNDVIITPALDKMHGESVRLTNYHVDPTCSPTRSALMTGRYSDRVGVWHTIMGRSILWADEKTMGDVFQAGGYRTGVFGKWHLGDTYPFRPQDRGFDEVLVHGGGGVCQTPDYWDNNYFDDTYYHNGKPEKQEGYCTDVWFDAAIKFIEQSKKEGKPFLAYIPTNAPHGPLLVAEKYAKMYEGKKVNAKFCGMITNIDENMAKLRKKLKELGLEKNTILIFTTDNGTAGGRFNAGMKGHKGSEYDGGHRVPCFFYWPDGGLTGGRDVARLTAHMDMLPTLIDLCGLKKPKGVKFDGMSIAPLLRGNDKNWPDRELIVESQRIDHPTKWRKCAVMTDRWRLVNGKELYDMQSDPGQAKNVAAEHPDVVERLRKVYDNWWADVSKNHDKYAHIVIGNDAENPATITCHDWHGPKVPWNHGHIRSGTAANGFWAIRVDRDGTYEFELRRWPKEKNAPINEGPGIQAQKARLVIGEVDETVPVKTGDIAARFKVKLKAGKTRLQTYFIGEGDKSRGAYYVYVKRVE